MHVLRLYMYNYICITLSQFSCVSQGIMPFTPVPVMLLTQVSSQLLCSDFFLRLMSLPLKDQRAASTVMLLICLLDRTPEEQKKMIYMTHIHIHKTKSFALINYSVLEGHISHTIAIASFHYKGYVLRCFPNHL